jgi:hypothetical protein
MSLFSTHTFDKDSASGLYVDNDYPTVRVKLKWGRYCFYVYFKFLDFFTGNSKKMGREGKGNGANTKYIDQQPQKWRPQRFIWGFPPQTWGNLGFPHENLRIR